MIDKPNLTPAIMMAPLVEMLSKENTTETGFACGFFNVRTANQCLKDAQTQPIPRDLYYSMIFEGEICILFADNGIGKSIFAVQIADYISRTDRVLYFDLELSDKQFESRYSANYQNHYLFNDNFYRVNFMRPIEIPDKTEYDTYFIECLKEAVNKTDAKIVIIDNMSSLIDTDTDSAKAAIPLMRRLQDLKFENDLTLLLLEHNKKVDKSRPIVKNDLQGSKMKSNFADSILSIGSSEIDKHIRYVKQIKVRSGEMIYDSENVAVYEKVQEDSFLQLKFIKYGVESEHLKQQNEIDVKKRIEEVKELSTQGKTQRQISTELGISLGTVNKYLKNK